MATGPGGLSLQDMRAKFRERFADLDAAPALSDAVVDTYLNGAHRFALPTEVDGDLKRGEWVFSTVAGQEVYPFQPAADGTFVHGLTGRMWVGDYPINVYRDFDRFYAIERPTAGAQAKPTAALIHGGEVRLRAVPDAVYTVRAPGTLYPDELAADGLDFRPRALAVVCLAVREAFHEIGEHDQAAAAEIEAGVYIDQVRTQSLATPRGRVPVRSF